MFLGIDLGTSSLKLVVINDDAEVIVAVNKQLLLSRPRELFSEQCPDDWIEALDDLMVQLSQKIDKHTIKAVGLSGQMHGSVILNQNYRPLRPAILWNDGRSIRECRDLEESLPNFRIKSGNLAMPGFTSPKLLWVARHEAHIFKEMSWVCLPKDFLRYYLTGELGTDPSDASGTLWMDPKTRRWDEELCAASGISIDILPKIQCGNEVAGELRASLTKKWGMKPVVVAVGAGDNASLLSRPVIADFMTQ